MIKQISKCDVKDRFRSSVSAIAFYIVDDGIAICELPLPLQTDFGEKTSFLVILATHIVMIPH